MRKLIDAGLVAVGFLLLIESSGTLSNGDWGGLPMLVTGAIMLHHGLIRESAAREREGA